VENNSTEKNIMQVSVDKKVCAPLVLCFTAVCALTFLIIPTAGSASNGGACDGNTAKTTSVKKEFSHSLDVSSSVECETPDEFGGCRQKNDTRTRNSSLDFSQVLDDGQTPGDLTVFFTSSSEPTGPQGLSYSEGFSVYISCRKSANDDCATEAMIKRPVEGGKQRSVYTENNSGQRTIHNAEKWTIRDIDDSESGISLRTRASSTIGSKNEPDQFEDYSEFASANITIEDIQLQICESTNDPPTAVDDGNNDASICNSGPPQNIDVLGNDTDPDGDDDDLTVDSVENPTDLGGTATVGGDGDYVQYTPPFDETGTDTFDYTAKDTNDNTATATVSVNLDAEDCGDISVSFQDDNGNSVSVDDAYVKYNDDELSGSGNSFSYEVDLFDDGRDALIEENFITPPEGYRIPTEWVEKDEGVPTYNQPNKSELGF
jgi:hypothetical protein